MVDSSKKGQPFACRNILAVAQVDNQVNLFRPDTGCAVRIIFTGAVQIFQFLVQFVRIHVVTVSSLSLVILTSAGTVSPGGPPLFHTLVPEQIRDTLRRHLYRLLWRCPFVSVSKSRGIFLTRNSPGTGGVCWRLLACPIAFRDNKTIRFRQFFHCLFSGFTIRLFFGFHFRFHRRDIPFFRFYRYRHLFLSRFSGHMPAPFLPFFFHRIEPSGNAPQDFCHAAAHFPETYLAEFAPEQELVHEQISEQQPE